MFLSFGLGIIFFSVLASVAVGNMTACKKMDAYDGSCISIDMVPENEMFQSEAEAECKSKSEYEYDSDYSWDLPRMDEPYKKKIFYEILDDAKDEKTELPEKLFYFWIRLKRGKPNKSEPNLNEWNDSEMWSWGKSTLKTWPKDIVELPWAPNQPDNAHAEYRPESDSEDDTEQCVMAAQNDETMEEQMKEFYWYDGLCGSDPMLNFSSDYAFVVVCEGTPLPTDDPPTTLADLPPTTLPNLPPTTTMNQNQKDIIGPTTETPFPWPWLMGGMAIGLVLVAAVIVAVAVYVRHRRQSKSRKRHHHRREVSSSSSRRTPSARARGSRRSNEGSSGSRRQHRGDRFSRRHSDKKPTEEIGRKSELARMIRNQK